MSPDPIWPNGPTEVGLWAQLSAAWIIAAYAVVEDQSTVPEEEKPGAPAPPRGGRRSWLYLD
jgi:hypothetical protein